MTDASVGPPARIAAERIAEATKLATELETTVYWALPPDVIGISSHQAARAYTRRAAQVIRALLLALDAAQAERDEAQRAEERMCEERDAVEEAADRLAYAIAPIEAIGEHSNLNDPWQNALDEIESIKERAEAWGLLNQMRESDQKKVIAAEAARDAAVAEAERLRAQLKAAYIAGWGNGYYDGGEHDCRMFEPTAERSWEGDDEAAPFRALSASPSTDQTPRRER